MRRIVAAVVGLLMAPLSVRAESQRSGPPAAAPGALPAQASPTEGLPAAEFLVPPGGGAYEVPVKIGEVCILTFPGEVTHSAVRSLPTFEVNPWNKDALAVRALPGATSATLAVSTLSGAIKVNVTLRVGQEGERTWELVTFRAVTAEEAYEAKVAAEVSERAAPRLAALETERQALEREIAAKRERLIVERAQTHSASKKLRGLARSADQQVVLRVERSFFLGDDAYLPFVIDNRGAAPFAVAQARVVADKAPAFVQAAVLHTSKPERGLGAVPAKASVKGVVVVRDAAKLRGTGLSLTISEVGERRVVTIDHGLSLP